MDAARGEAHRGHRRRGAVRGIVGGQDAYGDVRNGGRRHRLLEDHERALMHREPGPLNCCQQIRRGLGDPLERLGSLELALAGPYPLHCDIIERRLTAEDRPCVIGPPAVRHEERERSDLLGACTGARHRVVVPLDPIK
jgi:hypothetical protein